MPKPLTNKEYRELVALAYDGKIKPLEKYAGSTTKIEHKCCVCFNVWEVAPTALVSRKQKGVPLLKVGCPLCGKAENIKSNTGKSGTTTLSEDDWLDRLHRKSKKEDQPKIKIVGKYKHGNADTKFKCLSCLSTFNTTPLLLLQRKHLCSCYNKRLRKNNVIDKKLGKTLRFLYKELNFNLFQLSKFSGLSETHIREYASTKGWINKEVNAFKTDRNHRTMLLEAEDSNDKRAYIKNARRLTSIILNKYKHIIDPDAKLDSGYELDHMLSLHDAFTKSKKGPIDLKIVCHPANLNVITAERNRTKGSTSEGVSTLKDRIAEFDKKHGFVKFPKHFRYDYRKPDLDLSKVDGLRVLGFDPGTANFGVSASTLYGTDSIRCVEVHESSMIENPVVDFTEDMYEQYTKFTREIRSYINTYKPHIIVVERFASRGLKGKTIELVSLMIGAILATAYACKDEGDFILVKPVMPASWKNQVNRIYSIQELYDTFKSHKVVAHKVDAALMSMYLFPSKQNPYSFLANKTKREKWINEVINSAQTFPAYVFRQ